MIAVGVVIDGVEDAESFPGQVFGGRNAVENDGLVVGQAVEEIEYRGIARIDQEGVIPARNDVLLRQCLDVAKIHHHAVGLIAGAFDDVSGKRHLEGVAMAVQVAALTLMVGDAMSGIEFEAAGDEHAESLKQAGGNEKVGRPKRQGGVGRAGEKDSRQKADGAIAERKLYHPPIDDRPGPASGIPEVKSP